MSKKAKGIVAVAASVVVIVTAVILITQFASGSNVYEVGKTVRFGEWKWQVLDIQDGKALLITKPIVEKRIYNEWTEVTWETCTLRAYLNSEFLEKLSAEEQARICDTENVNLHNQWSGTSGGSSTTDKVFLLSIEEVVKYFGDSGQLKNKNPDSQYQIDDQYNGERVARFKSSRFWWWLRSPGFTEYYAAFVHPGGEVSLNGNFADYDGIGIRPALWLKID